MRDKEGNHSKIMRAAWSEFLEYGFAEASMRRIAAAAGMSVSGLYKHFPSKEEMFSALVEPAYNGFMALYRMAEMDERARLQENGAPILYENGNDARKAVSYIYDNLDAFRLIICKAQGTKYENFLHELAEMEEKTTLAFMELLKSKGKAINEVSMKEFHLLATANVNAVFQTVEHDFTREEAMHYADTLDRFFDKGWREFFGY